MRSLDWWMRKRQLPKGIRQRVRQYERQRWAAMRGVDECKMIQDLPEGLRKEIKYHLCLDLVRQVLKLASFPRFLQNIRYIVNKGIGVLMSGLKRWCIILLGNQCAWVWLGRRSA